MEVYVHVSQVTYPISYVQVSCDWLAENSVAVNLLCVSHAFLYTYIGAVLNKKLHRTNMIYTHGLDLLSGTPTIALREQVSNV